MVIAALLITDDKQIDNAKVVHTGYGKRTVRMLYDEQQIGFATTTYSHHMSDEMKEYAAERIMLLMKLAEGYSNAQIAAQLSNKSK